MLQFALTSFVTLLVVVDPFGGTPFFMALTKHMTPAARRALLTRAVLIAWGITLFFLFAGRALLSYLGVTVHAFAISGGALLFVTAMPMLFGQRPGLQSSRGEENPAAEQNLAIFPLAIPLMSGPGAIATILLLTSQAGGQPAKLAALTGVVTAVFVLVWTVLNMGERLLRALGEGRANVITRVMGILLAALAVQYILNGVRGYILSLAVSAAQTLP